MEAYSIEINRLFQHKLPDQSTCTTRSS